MTASETKKKKKVIVISGLIDFDKSRLALELAKRLNGKIVSIKVSVKCEGVKNLAMATTEDKGFFKFGSSKSFDLPLPREWGLAPSSFYVPFFPIIGIP
ncbi:hypothetical protein glysoja_026204 [Glycine soja]|uniref:Uncharacterized protein n=2 Tax=Glycine soja TaxID=3848 RepID=A0A0B2R747_GLYSO|nr:hypothetical protein glysoja_026204 [Glycine soja]